MKPHNTRVAGFAVALAIASAVAFPPAPVHAGLAEAGGSFAQIQPPHSVRKHAFESDQTISVFLEHSSLTLDHALRVNATAPGEYDSRFDLHTSWIEAGTVIDSYFVHNDPTGAFGKIRLTGTLTFDEPILGVIVRKGALWKSDAALGAEETLYPLPSRVGRGLELAPSRDWFSISEDLRTISLHLSARRAMDQLRIMTGSPVPAPAGLALMTIALLGSRRKR